MDILSDKIVTTRKKHMCCACGRGFEKGTRMRTQVNTLDGIQTWRECPTCQQLLSKHRSHFEDEDDNVCYEFCVDNARDTGQTPEELLIVLNNHLTNQTQNNEQETGNNKKSPELHLRQGV